MDTPLAYTAAGWESQLATNHLGHFALATGLHEGARGGGGRPGSCRSPRAATPARVPLRGTRLPAPRYTPNLGYGQSKTANVLFAVEAQRRWGSEGVTANALMPGGIWTGLRSTGTPSSSRSSSAPPATS